VHSWQPIVAKQQIINAFTAKGGTSVATNSCEATIINKFRVKQQLGGNPCFEATAILNFFMSHSLIKKALFLYSMILKLHYFIFFVLILCTSCLYTKTLSKDHKLSPNANLKTDILPHNRNSLEWWYFAGHLTDSSQKNYGIMFTVFKKYIPVFGHQIMVNYTLTNEADTSFKKLVSYQKVKRKYLMKNPLLLQSENRKLKWRIQQINGDSLVVEITPKKNNIPAATLFLKATKSIIKQTSTGYMNFGKAGQAGYISYPQMQTNAILTTNGNKTTTTGSTWFDKQWNCINIVKPHLSWKWICIQFSNNQELMIFNTYNKKTKENIIQGSYCKPNGNMVFLKPQDIIWAESEYYKSKTGRIYPTKISLNIPSLNINGFIQPNFLNHEIALNLGLINFMTYWEGKCNANFTIDNKSVNGNAFLEMTNMPGK
jgi:predicted secreted hydrolase